MHRPHVEILRFFELPKGCLEIISQINQLFRVVVEKSLDFLICPSFFLPGLRLRSHVQFEKNLKIFFNFIIESRERGDPFIFCLPPLHHSGDRLFYDFQGNPLLPPAVEYVKIFSGYKKSNPVFRVKVMNNRDDIIVFRFRRRRATAIHGFFLDRSGVNPARISRFRAGDP